MGFAGYSKCENEANKIAEQYKHSSNFLVREWKDLK